MSCLIFKKKHKLLLLHIPGKKQPRLHSEYLMFSNSNLQSTADAGRILKVRQKNLT